jgi:hypothetical protein
MINIMRTIRQSFFTDAKKDKPGHKGYRFLTADEIRKDGYGYTPSRSRNRGRQPGSFKRKRDMVRASRRRNRGAKRR